MLGKRIVRREVRQRRWGLLVGTQLGRFLLRKRLARERQRAMKVLAGATVGGLILLTLAAAYERARDQ